MNVNERRFLLEAKLNLATCKMSNNSLYIYKEISWKLVVIKKLLPIQTIVATLTRVCFVHIQTYFFNCTEMFVNVGESRRNRTTT